MSACAVGFFAIQTLPLRLGELVRPTMLSRVGVPFGRAVGAVAVERLLDLLVLLAMIAATGRVPLPEVIRIRGVDVLAVAQDAAALSALILVLLLTLAFFVGEAMADRAPAPIGRLLRAAASTSRDLGLSRLLFGLFLSASVWACNIATVSALLRALPGLPTGVDTALTVCTVTVAGVLAVPTPGMLGAFEASARAALAPWSVDPARAATLAILWHSLTFGFHAMLGVAGLIREGVSLRELVARANAPR